jgi:hypothetical protein
MGCFGTVADPEPEEEVAGPGATPGTNGEPGALPGSPGGGNGPVNGTPTVGSPSLPADDTSGCQEASPQVTAARRLTRDQYVNTVRDLLGDAAANVGGDLPKDDVADDIFVDPRSLIVSPDWASSAMDAAEAVAKTAIGKMSTLLPCSAGETGCSTKFINAFGKRAFRRPLEGDEVVALGKVFELGEKNGGFSHGIELVVRALLQSPSFLYRLELGQKDGSSGSSVRLTGYEVAARLSYVLWNTMPDQSLMDAADGGKLETGEQILTQARRMMEDPRAHRTLGEFHARWLGVDGLGNFAKDPMKYPQYGDKMVASMRTELQMLVEDVLFAGDGRLESLFNASHGFVDATLAPVYGVTAPAGGGFSQVELDPKQRRGLLTNAAIIASHTFADESAPIHRGKFVREGFLCTIPPEPPADLMVEPPVAKPGQSTRQRLAEHASMPACRGCHVLMDPIGLSFEAYDGLGRFRTTDQNGKPVDDSGVLDNVKDFSDPFMFHGPLELTEKLAESKQVRECLIGNVIKFAAGLDAANDTCLQQKLTAAFDSSRHDIRELFLAITKTTGFRFRRAIQGEVLP